MDETTTTLMSINAVLEEHARQIQTLVAANRALDEKHQAQVERHQAQVDVVKAEYREKCDSLERRCGVLEARCSSLERSIQVLKKDVEWTYKAPDIPRRHWIEQGRDEEYADNMERFLRAIKYDVEYIRNESEDRYYADCLENENAPTILHDDALLPHFKELADAVQVTTADVEFWIENIELHPKVLGILCPVMEGKVTAISMRHMRFPVSDVKCYEIITTSIGRNYTLKVLSWVHNRIPSDEQAGLLIKSAIHNQSIHTLHLDNCFDQTGVNGCRALTTLMTCGRPFDALSFRRNGLSGIDDVAAAMATNPQLKELDWIDNELNDRDAELIAQALKQNTNLQELYLHRNGITSAGFERIGTTIYDPSSLNAMESCNYTCWVDDVAGNEHGKSPLQNRNRKLYELLSTRHGEGSNARCLNVELGEEPHILKLVPKVLDCIQRLSAERSVNAPAPLSLVFELIKSWKMPELYGRR